MWTGRGGPQQHPKISEQRRSRESDEAAMRDQRGGSRETRTPGLGLALHLADDKRRATSRTSQAQDDIQVTATTKAAD
jgi:hypothetical protein